MMILPCLYIADSFNRGRGVFTSKLLSAGKTIEISPVIVMSQQEKILLDQTLLHDYIFHWGRRDEQCCLALGYLSIYNHDYSSNAEYEMDFAAATGVDIFVIGNAPTALFRIGELINEGRVSPKLVVGVPVGFVGAAESKEYIRAVCTKNKILT